MSERTYTYFTPLIGVVCGWVVIRWSFSPASLTLPNALVQGVLVGAGGWQLSQFRRDADRRACRHRNNRPARTRRVQEFLRFQIAEHKTGDPTAIPSAPSTVR
jgi:hypothetical protein